mmetsp:Transcript_1036/g.3299  ORF Transcript_1036/g.3299 Transcript_1036/m.3299 type:complete len:241 (-) Transcript_1036:263-985(-)
MRSTHSSATKRIAASTERSGSRPDDKFGASLAAAASASCLFCTCTSLLRSFRCSWLPRTLANWCRNSRSLFSSWIPRLDKSTNTSSAAFFTFSLLSSFARSPNHPPSPCCPPTTPLTGWAPVAGLHAAEASPANPCASRLVCSASLSMKEVVTSPGKVLRCTSAVTGSAGYASGTRRVTSTVCPAEVTNRPMLPVDSDSFSVPRPPPSSVLACRISSQQLMSKLPHTSRCTSCTAFTNCG